jgi:preprotein translocase subunit YajC
MLLALTTLLAQAADPAKGPPAEGPPGWTQFMPIVLMVVAFYFILFLPSRRERQQRAQLLAALKKNDEVETAGGIFGIVQSIKENGDEVVLKLEDNAKMRVRRSSIVRILSRESAAGAAGTTTGGSLSEAIQKPPRG